MAVAIGTGDPLQGALLMLAFTLGTSPVFFAVAYLTTQIGARLEKWFMRFVAVVVLVLGIVTYISGLRLAGVPINLPDWLQTGSWSAAGSAGCPHQDGGESLCSRACPPRRRSGPPTAPRRRLSLALTRSARRSLQSDSTRGRPIRSTRRQARRLTQPRLQRSPSCI